MNYKTPGVYVEEKALFPPSVAQVATAIPAFVGYTEKAIDDDENDVTTFPYIKRIKSLLEYEFYFGKTESQVIDIELSAGEPAGIASGFTQSVYRLYYAMQMYYANGGGPCYIVCVGKQGSGIVVGDIISSLADLKKKDEPTILVFPDAETVAPASYYSVFTAALDQCKTLGDRFTLIDVQGGKDNSAASIGALRDGIGTNYLNYGAAYTPFLNTNLNYYAHDGTITFSNTPVPAKIDGENLADIKAYLAALEYQKTVVAKQAEADAGSASVSKAAALATAQAAVAAGEAVVEATALTGSDSTNADAALVLATTALTNAEAANLPAGTQANAKAAATAAVDATTAIIAAAELNAAGLTAAELTTVQETFNTDFENKLKVLLSNQYLTIPPSAAIAGVYASVDRNIGVWKAPANVSLNNVIAPSAKITAAEQENLNIHESGKSINAIRSFTGKGTMVWGARTLAGNDNEWRYISVRRFFNMVEESVKKATEVFVFEPNDANTWVRVRAMIENFLTLQWRAGALAGAVPEDAFYVKVGLGQTMTPVDILDGRMIVEIGMAVVRPAEFIILQFSHKMQES